MKFFNIIPLSNFRLDYSAYPYDVPNTLVPSHRLCFQYSMPRNLLPRNASPNIFSPILGILFAALWMFSLSIVSLSYLYLAMVDILYACVHGPYSLHPLRSSHSHCYKSVPVNRDIVLVHLLSKHDNDIWSPKLCEHLTNLQYESSFENLPNRN